MKKLNKSWSNETVVIFFYVKNFFMYLNIWKHQVCRFLNTLDKMYLLFWWPKIYEFMKKRKKLHMGNTLPSSTCVNLEYQYYTMSKSQYHWCCRYHKSIPWVLAKTMSPCLNNVPMSIPWVNVCTRSLILYHASISIHWEIQFSGKQKYK